MLGPILAFLFPSVSAEFASDYPLAESVERLRGIFPATFSERLFRSTAQGVVTERQVCLARVVPFVPFVDNSCRPLFLGSFQQTGRGVVLSGRFTTARWVKESAGFGIGVAVFFAALSILGTLLGLATVWWAPLPGLGLVALKVGGLKWSQWLSRGDVPWLSRVIRRALTTPDKWPPEEPPKPGWLRRHFLSLAGQ